MLHVTVVTWGVTLSPIAGLLAVDWLLLARRPHEIGLGEAVQWSAFYIAVAVLFGVVFGASAGWEAGTQYFAGYVVEKSLSVDNLFVFVIILSAFAVPAAQQPKVLTIGIVIALALRAVFIALLAIGCSDLLFAFDSIPAVYGVTNHPYIVFAANAFALLGLRALYFLVSGLLDRLVYLSTGLAAILAFIGAKLVLGFAHQQNHAIPEVSTGVSLVVIAAVLGATTIASVSKARRDPTARTHAGPVRQPRARCRPKPPGGEPLGGRSGDTGGYPCVREIRG